MCKRGSSIIDKLSTPEKEYERSKQRGRDNELVENRNQKLCYRLYYYAVFHKLNYDEVMNRLQSEFDLKVFTIGKIASDRANDIMAIKKAAPALRELKKYILCTVGICPINQKKQTKQINNMQNWDNEKPKDLKDMTMQDMMENEVAEMCLSDNPQLFKSKWIAAYGHESWENSVYAKMTEGKI